MAGAAPGMRKSSSLPTILSKTAPVGPRAWRASSTKPTCAGRGERTGDPPFGGVDDERGVDEAGPSRDLGQSETHSAFGRGAWNCQSIRVPDKSPLIKFAA